MGKGVAYAIHSQKAETDTTLSYHFFKIYIYIYIYIYLKKNFTPQLSQTIDVQ